MKNLILFDIDGVLLPTAEQYSKPDPEEYETFLKQVQFNADCVKQLVLLCKQLDAKLMLLSRWRKIFSDHLDLLKEALVRSGIDEGLFAEHWSCSYRFTSGKVHEIWMAESEFKEEIGDTPVRILVIDDDFVVSPRDFSDTLQQIRPESIKGMTKTDVEKALHIHETWKLQ